MIIVKKKSLNLKINILTTTAATGAIYAVLTIILSPISYGPIQARLSEVLCVLPFFLPETAWGLAVGCAIANLMTGNIFDVIFGSLATLAAGMAAAAIGKRGKESLKNKILACLMPVLFNSFVISAVILCAYNGKNILDHFGMYLLYAFEIGAGEALVMFAGGLPMMKSIPRLKIFQNTFDF